MREKIPAARRKGLLEGLVRSCEFVSSLENKSAHIVGHIDSETAKKWLDWNLGELFVVACDGDFVFCFQGGTIVPV